MITNRWDEGKSLGFAVAHRCNDRRGGRPDKTIFWCTTLGEANAKAQELNDARAPGDDCEFIPGENVYHRTYKEFSRLKGPRGTPTV